MDRTPGAQCTICNHPQRVEIDKALVAGVSYRAIAGQYGVSREAVGRHKRNGHIAEHIAKAAQKKEIKRAASLKKIVEEQEEKTVAEAKTLLDEATSLKARALTILDNAENEGTREACLALREVRGIIELLAKVQGELPPDGTTVNINIIETQFNDFRTAVVGVMCPDCQRRLAEQLRARVGK